MNLSRLLTFSFFAVVLLPKLCSAAELLAGWASVDITPDRPVALAGQMHTRISKSVHDPITATALALEGKTGDGRSDVALLISCDAPGREGLMAPLRQRVKALLPGFDTTRLLLNATHTHTAPETDDTLYEMPADRSDVMKPAEYREFMIARLTDAAVRAWNARKPAAMGYGLTTAVIARNRRISYYDGKSLMYGPTKGTDFSHIEGYEDHAVHSVFFWSGGKLVGVAVAIPCPSQEIEGEQFVSADFWDDVRTQLRSHFGPALHVYAITGASGDQSPHHLFRQKAEERMRAKRGLTTTGEIGRRIALAVVDAYEVVKGDQQTDVVFEHRAEILQLPRRMVTDEEAMKARQELKRLDLTTSEDKTRSFVRYFDKQIVERHEQQRTNPFYPAEVHAIRLGDIAFATNPFELFTDFGIAIEAQSPAVQTIVVQLSSGYGGYLPTVRGLAGGHYSTQVQSNEVGAEGGRWLVAHTVRMISSLW